MTTDFTPWPEALAAQYRQLGYWQDKTLLDYLQQSAERTPNALALVGDNQQWRYQAMLERIEQLAAGFTELGLGCGDNVVLQLGNVAEFYLCFFALLRQGIRPILALPAHRLAEIRYFCQHSQAKAYLIDGAQRPFDYQVLAQELLACCPTLQNVIVRGQTRVTDPKFIELASCYSASSCQANADPNQIAFFQLSGGTTGTPKLIPRTHNDYAYSVTASVEICRFDQHTRYLCVLPAAHNFPLSSPGALGVFWAGGCVVLSQDASPQHAFKLIEQHKITVTALVPPLALLWMDHAEKSTCDLSSLHFVQVGGAKFSEAAARRLPKALGCQLQQVFGMAEGLVNYTRLDDSAEVIATTQGRPISAHDQLLVVDEQGLPVASGEEGYLLTQGPYTIRGYYRAEQHNQRAFNAQGFYITGDKVKPSSEGYVIVTGRAKDQINRGGEKIAAEEVENQLLHHPAVHDAALIAISDEYLGERSCAVIVLKPEQSVNTIQLKRFLHQAGLADYKIPDQIQFIDQLPKTSVGKIDKNALRRRFDTLGLALMS
ncbi:(2,3-dihydroxybenzoyl)adenylate synthase [Vibrio cholerae]